MMVTSIHLKLHGLPLRKQWPGIFDWQNHVTDLQGNFFDGEVIIFGQENEQGAAADNYDKTKQQKLTAELLLEMIKLIDQQHAEGCSVTNGKIQMWLREVHCMEVSHRTIKKDFQDWVSCGPKSNVKREL